MMLSYVDEKNVLNLCTIEDALEIECGTQFEDAGQIESAVENLIALSRSLGRLITVLHKVGIITDDVLLNDILPPGAYEVCKD